MLGVERRSLGLMLGVLAGCFAEPSPADRQCTPGTQISCDCFKGDGVQVCRLSGDGFEPCQCRSGATKDAANE